MLIFCIDKKFCLIKFRFEIGTIEKMMTWKIFEQAERKD